jgi:hypothetical protein
VSQRCTLITSLWQTRDVLTVAARLYTLLREAAVRAKAAAGHTAGAGTGSAAAAAAAAVAAAAAAGVRSGNDAVAAIWGDKIANSAAGARADTAGGKKDKDKLISPGGSSSSSVAGASTAATAALITSPPAAAPAGSSSVSLADGSRRKLSQCAGGGTPLSPTGTGALGRGLVSIADDPTQSGKAEAVNARRATRRRPAAPGQDAGDGLKGSAELAQYTAAAIAAGRSGQSAAAAAALVGGVSRPSERDVPVAVEMAASKR